MSSLRNKFKEKKQSSKSKPERFADFGDALTQHVKADIVILEELRQLIPPLKEEEFVLLKNSIAKEGVRDPLLLWQSPENEFVLVDGHNRYRIIQELEAEGHKVKYGTKHLLLESFEAVKDWMIINQLGRRNLTNEQRSYLRGLRYEREKRDHGGERASPQNGNLRTHEKLADEYKVSKNTILRDAEFARGIEKVGDLNADLKHQILKGDASLRKSDLQLLGRNNEKIEAALNSKEDLVAVIDQLKKKPAPKKKIGRAHEIKKMIYDALEGVDNNSSSEDFVRLHHLLDKLEGAMKKG